MLILKCTKPIIEALSYVFQSLFANPKLETCLVWIRHQPGQGKQRGHRVWKSSRVHYSEGPSEPLSLQVERVRSSMGSLQTAIVRDQIKVCKYRWSVILHLQLAGVHQNLVAGYLATSVQYQGCTPVRRCARWLVPSLPLCFQVRVFLSCRLCALLPRRHSLC